MTERPNLRSLKPTATLDELPDVLTVEEAARVLRISRGAAYELVAEGYDRDAARYIVEVRLGHVECVIPLD